MIGLKKEIFFQVALENSIVSSKALYQNSIVKRTIDGENCVRKRVLMGGERERAWTAIFAWKRRISMVLMITLLESSLSRNLFRLYEKLVPLVHKKIELHVLFGNSVLLSIALPQISMS